MKTVLLALAATIAGCSIGFALTYWELTRVGPLGLSSPVEALKLGSNSATDTGEGRPKVVVAGGTAYDFGTMEKGSTLSHAFVFKNEGTKPLTLVKGETSCKCTLSDLANGALAPGESTEVVLKWTPKDYDPRFSQTAEIQTNDPVQPMVLLTVSGKVIQSVRTQPESVTLGSLGINEPANAEVMVLAYPDEPLEIEKIEWAEAESAEFFEAEVLPLPAEQLASDPDAKTGKLVKIRIKPGLPLGPINQKIRITTSFPDMPVLEVPLVLTVTGDISIIGRGFVSESNTLMLGRVKSAEGITANLNLLVKGAHREGIEFAVGEVKPSDVLQVKLGERKSLKEGVVFLVPLEVSVAAGSRSANHIGAQPDEQGLIVLETSHPDIKQITIHVRFAVD